VPRVKLRLKFRKGNYLPGKCDVGRLQEKNLTETYQEYLNTKLKSFKFDNVEKE
jgi:hypothetical protein